MSGRFARFVVGGASLAAVAALLAVAVNVAAAQGSQLAPKRNPGSSNVSCPAAVGSPQAGQPRRAAAEQSFSLGQEAAIAGDNRQARDHFRRAAEADPTDAAVAYHLARTHEALGEVNEAVREYCRYLALAPRAADAAEARERLTELGPRRTQSELATAQFRAGVRYLDETRWREAQTAFSRAIEAAPDWPETHFNRALVLERLDMKDRALEDFQRYLELEPGASDRELVLQRMVALRRSGMSPGSALARGLLVPGLGQHYTHRPVLGFIVLGAVGGAVAFGFQPEDVERTETRRGQFTDPFGNVREYEYEHRYFERSYPYRDVGLAAAAAISLLAAFEAYQHARRAGDDVRVDSSVPTVSESRTVVPLLAGDRVGVLIRFR